MEYVLAIIIAAAVMTSVIISVMLRLRRSSVTKIIFLPLTDKVNNAELLLREAYSMAEASPSPCRIIIYNMGADEETLRICRIFASEHGGFEVVE